jgi:hypothetical protein
MTQETQKPISGMSIKELAEYLNLPLEIIHRLVCNWYEETTGWACIATDGYFEWRPLRVIILNSLPLNAFSAPTDLRIYPVNTERLLELLATLPHDYKCFVGHQPTSSLIEKSIPTKCTRTTYTYNRDDDILVAFVLKTRPAVSGTDIDVKTSDLAAYVIVPSPL